MSERLEAISNGAGVRFSRSPRPNGRAYHCILTFFVTVLRPLPGYTTKTRETMTVNALTEGRLKRLNR